MTFARRVFLIAGIWGVIIMTPLYFAFDYLGRAYPPAITHPDIYYGFVGVTLVWQVAFLIIATDPVRYRPLMIAAILEKGIYFVTLTVLLARGQILPAQFAVVSPDFVLGVLFVAAFVKTAERARRV